MYALLSAILELLTFILGRIFGLFGIHSSRTIAARDLFFETLTNAEKAASAASTGMAQKFASVAWQTHRPILTHLKADDFNKVRVAYESADHLEGFEPNWWTDKRMKETIARLGLEFLIAARTLESKALWRKERRQFDPKLAGLETRLQQNRDINAC